MKNADMPASPVINSEGFPTRISFIQDEPLAATGLTKREAFAMAAMQGLLASGCGLQNQYDLAHQSLAAADALLAELEKGQ